MASFLFIVNDNSHVLAKHYELLPSGRRFRVPQSNTVNSVSEQINLFKHHSSVCVCVCKLRKLLVCLLCNFCIFNNCSLVVKYKICVTVYCDVVNVQPRFNFSDEIIK